MTAEPTYRGIALDGATALALLEWSREMGIDEPMLDVPVDRFGAPEKPKTAAPPLPPVLRDDSLDWVALARDLAQAATSREALAEAIEAFEGIECRKGARNFVFSDGNPRARVLILGEAPGADEDAQGKPFVGRAGKLLDRMFEAIGLSRTAPNPENSLYIMNVMTWRPEGNRDPSADEIAMMRPLIERHIGFVDPDLIVLMGNTPLDAATGQRGILRERGNWVTAFGKPALPMTHPAYLLRRPEAKREAWADLLEISARLKSL